MAISNDQKIDYLFKKVGFGATKTDVNSVKLAANESISSPLLLRGDKVLQEASSIPGVLPGSTSGVVTVYNSSNPVECTNDVTASANRTWKTDLTDWIPPEFGSTYLVSVYIHTASDGANAVDISNKVFTTGSGNNDEWFFDYQSGVLNFIGDNLPNGVNFSGKSVYITGARYSGTFGVGTIGAQTNAFNQVDVYTSPSDASPDSIVASSGDTIDIVADGSIQVTADVANKKITFSTANIPSDLTDLGITDGTNTQVLTTDGSGNFTFQDSLVTGTIPSHEIFTGDGTTINFTLSTTPIDVESIDVYVDNVIQRPGVGENFTLIGAVISTNGTMPVGSEMYVKHRSAHATSVSPLAGSIGNAALNLTYTSNQYTGNGSNTDFTIPSGHNRDSLLAIVGGSIYLPTQYSISGTTLSFNTAPGAGASIDFRYFPI
jgi:hypothetical protein